MDITKKLFYYFSVEFNDSYLPIKCQYIKRLEGVNAKEGREIALIELVKYSDEFSLPRYLVIVPRSLEESIFGLDSTDPVFLYVLDGSSYIDQDSIDLAPDKQSSIDVGGVTFAHAKAAKWQMSDELVKASDEYMKKL